MGFDDKSKAIRIGSLTGKVLDYYFTSDDVKDCLHWSTALTSFATIEGRQYVTEIGVLNPSEEKKGRVLRIEEDTVVLVDSLHRPVHTLVEDLNNDGTVELVISEFGHLTGQLSLLIEQEDGSFDKR